jgi:two-component system chemotaxis response regulator CheY
MKRILIIEDDPVVTDIYRHKYSAAGYEVASASDGDEGLRKVHEFKPDLLQLDLMVPKVNGVEIIEALRARPEFRSLPIVVLSSGYSSDMVKAAIKAGANRCISKQTGSPRHMLETVDALLNPPAQSSGAPLSPAPSAAGPPSGAGLSEPSSSVGEETLILARNGRESDPADPRGYFLRQAGQIKADLRTRLYGFIKSRDTGAQLSQLEAVGQTVHSLAGRSGLAGLNRISHMAGALEALLKELRGKPKQITPSTLRTVANAVECLDLLIEEAATGEEDFRLPVLILTVDDEPLSRLTLSTALGKAGLKAITLDDPGLALKILALNRFDLIFLDVDMPGMDGFDLCKKLRTLPTNLKTPVVFVTGLSDFESRARSALSGGNDLIAKPFLLTELAVKALTFLVKGRPASPAAAPPPSPRARERTE